MHQFFLDTVQFHPDIGHRYAHNGSDFVVADSLQPEQHKPTVHHIQLVDKGIKLPNLFKAFVQGVIRVDVGAERNSW